MAHFHFENQLNELTRMDAPIQSGPKMRWQRNALESGISARLHLPKDNSTGNSPKMIKSAKTPGKTPRTPCSAKSVQTPSKTPGKGAGKHGAKTPTGNKKTPKTPGHSQQDRFIPNRNTTDIDMGHYAITNKENDDGSPSKYQYQQQLDDALAKGLKPKDSKILSFKQKAQPAKEGHLNNLRVIYSGKSSAASVSKSSSTRHIPQRPERILDAPDLLDDYYLNLLDWSANNHLAVSLNDNVYLWNAGDGNIVQLFETESRDEYICSISWVKEGNFLGVGLRSGAVQLWDAEQQKLIRTMRGHAARVGSLSWNSYILSSGSRSGSIYHHDVRVADHHVATLSSHSQEVCGLQWSPDGRYLASGGNDNMLNIWDATLGQDVVPVHTFTHHQAAVKAIAWCPWQPQLLASGAGTADRHIRFWNVATGACLNSVDTSSQVSSILWSKEYKELISGHGYSKNQLTIWKYPSMSVVTELIGHQARTLCLAMSPDGTTVASVAADETICLWKCFESEKSHKPSVIKTSKESKSSVSMLNKVR